MNTTPQPKPSPKAGAIGALIFLVAIGLTLWVCFAEIWPASMLIKFQAKIFDGSYYPKMTFLLTLLIFLLPMLGIQWIVQKMIGKKGEE